MMETADRQHVHALAVSVSSGTPPHPDIVREWCIDCDFEAARFRWSE